MLVGEVATCSYKATYTYHAGAPADALEQCARLDFERTGQLGEGVDLGNTPTPLKQPNLRAVERSSKS